jgi:hypothetical protein
VEVANRQSIRRGGPDPRAASSISYDSNPHKKSWFELAHDAYRPRWQGGCTGEHDHRVTDLHRSPGAPSWAKPIKERRSRLPTSAVGSLSPGVSLVRW